MWGKTTQKPFFKPTLVCRRLPDQLSLLAPTVFDLCESAIAVG